MSSATQARALVASLLNGDLKTATHTSQRHELRFPNPVLPLRRSPVTSVTTVLVNGDAFTDYTYTPFALTREDGEPWPAGEITITYTTGWTEGNEADEVKEAIALATAYFDGNPGAGITSFKEGGEAVTVDGQEAVSAIRSVLRKWVRP